MHLKHILRKVESGELSAEAAYRLAAERDTDLDFAEIDTGRLKRRGFPEIIYCPGKAKHQIIDIMRVLADAGQDIFATRATAEQYDAAREVFPDAVYHEAARAITVDVAARPKPIGLVAVVSAGTSDLPVAEESALAAERLGARVKRICDVGVAGLHRLMRHMDVIGTARVVVVVAGMEGALPSVVGGLIDKPLIAVPTSVGYGTGIGGLSALLAMLNSCVPGICVVNIDNGLGAGVAAAMINRYGQHDDSSDTSRLKQGNGRSTDPSSTR